MATNDGWETVEYNDPRTVIPSVFPGARITSTSRSPDDPLSKRNPRSAHINNPNAFDMAPIPGMSFDDFKRQMEDNGYKVVGGIDEVNNPSAWATGPHWHGVLEKTENNKWEDVPSSQFSNSSSSVDPLTERLIAEQTPERIQQMVEGSQAAGTTLGPSPGGGVGKRVWEALQTPVLPEEYTRNDPTGLLRGVDALARVFGGAATELIRGTPLEAGALASPLGGLEVGGFNAALGRLSKGAERFTNSRIREGAPLEEINSALEQAGEQARVTPESYSAVREYFRQNPDAPDVSVADVTNAINENNIPGVNGRNQPEFEFGANDNQNAFGFEPPAELPRKQTVTPSTRAGVTPLRGANENFAELPDISREQPQVLDNPDLPGRTRRIPNPDEVFGEEPLLPGEPQLGTPETFRRIDGSGLEDTQDVTVYNDDELRQLIRQRTGQEPPADVIPIRENIDYDRLANEAQRRGDPNADLYWQSKTIAESGNHQAFTMEQLEDVMDGLDNSIKENPGNPLLQGIMDNLEQTWLQKNEAIRQERAASSSPPAANADTTIPPQSITDDLLEQDLINKEDIAYDIGFNDPRRLEDRRTKAYKEWEKDSSKAEQARDSAARKYYESLPTEELSKRFDTDRQLRGQADPVLQEVLLERIPEGPLKLEDPNKPGGSGPAGGGGEPPVETPAKRVLSALNRATREWESQQAERKRELGRRIGGAIEIGRNTEGEAGFHAEKSAMKGPLPTRGGPNISEFLSQGDIDNLFEQVKNFPDFESDFQPLAARNGLARLLEGQLPRPSEMKLLRQVFGDEDINSLVENRETLRRTLGRTSKQAEEQLEMFTGREQTSTGPMKTLAPEPKPVDPDKFIDDPLQGDFFREKPRFNKPPKKKGGNGGGGKDMPPLARTVNNFLVDVANIPFSLMSTWDLSAIRQGSFLISRPEFWKAAGKMPVYMFSPKAHKALMAEIESRPSFALMEKAGVPFTELGTKLTAREESMASKIVEAIPGIKGSNRAFNGFLNKLRADTFDSINRDFQKAGVDLSLDENLGTLRQLGRYIGDATGRGDLGSFNKYGPALNAAFFSPRLQASRINLMLRPFRYILEPFTTPFQPYLQGSVLEGLATPTHPIIKKNYFRDLAGFAGAVTTILAIAKDWMGLDVEDDPRSSDFAKIRDGNIRHDIMAGFQQYIRLGAQLATNQTKTLKGDIKDLGEGYKGETRLDKILTFLRSKGSPMATFVADYFDGKNVVGEPFEVQKAIVDRLTPFSFNAMADAYDEEGMWGVVKTLDGIIGASVQIFDPNAPKDKKEADATAPAIIQDVTNVENQSTPIPGESQPDAEGWITVQ